MNISIQISI